MKRLNVMHVVRDMGPGGAERVVLNYMKYMDRKRFSPTLCVLGKAMDNELKEIEDMGITFRCLKKSMGWDTAVLLALVRTIKDQQVDILHLHNFPAQLYGTIAALISSRPVILRTEHNVVQKRSNPLAMAKFRIKIMMGIFHKCVITVSDRVRESHVRHDRLFSNKYITIHNGIDTHAFDIHIDPVKYRKEFRFSDDHFIVGKVASMYPQKAHEVFLEAARLLLRRLPGARFLLIGDGPRRYKLEAMAGRVGLSDKVVFTGIRNDIAGLLKFLDVFVLSSAWEGFPLTILEAMASCTPVVVTNVGGNAEVVIDGETGLLVESGNPTALANAIAELGNDPKRRRKMGKAGKLRVKRFFTAQRMVRNTERLYARFHNVNYAQSQRNLLHGSGSPGMRLKP